MSEHIKIDESLLSKSIIKDYKKKWKVLDPFPSTLFFKMYSSLNGEMDLNYIPDYLYRFLVDHILSNFRYSSYTQHKGLYAFRYPELIDRMPDNLLYKINGVFYDCNYEYINDLEKYLKGIELSDVVTKESLDTGSGRGIDFFSKDEKNGLYYNKNGACITNALSAYTDVLIQKKIEQSSFMAKFNPTSVNTYRIVTYRSVITEHVHIMQSVLRVGKAGSPFDNLHAGGNLIAIKKGGVLASHGMDENGRKIFVGNDIVLPYIDKVHELAKTIAEKDKFNRQLFLDIYIDKDEEAKLLEINLTSFPTIQAYCGPAFAEFTDEVIDYCLKNSGNMVRLIPVDFRR